MQESQTVRPRTNALLKPFQDLLMPEVMGTVLQNVRKRIRDLPTGLIMQRFKEPIFFPPSIMAAQALPCRPLLLVVLHGFLVQTVAHPALERSMLKSLAILVNLCFWSLFACICFSVAFNGSTSRKLLMRLIYIGFASCRHGTSMFH